MQFVEFNMPVVFVNIKWYILTEREIVIRLVPLIIFKDEMEMKIIKSPLQWIVT